MNTSKFQWLNLSDEDLTDPSLSMEDLLGFSIHLYHYPKELHPIETMYDCWENLKHRDKETFGLLERMHAIQTGWYLAYSFYRLSDIDHAKEACQYAYSLTDTDLLAGDRISSLLLSAVISSFCQEAAQTEKSLEEVRYLLSQRSDKVDGLNFEFEVVAMRFALSQNDLPAAQKHEKNALSIDDPKLFPSYQDASESFVPGWRISNLDCGELRYATSLLAFKQGELDKALQEAETALNFFRTEASVQQVNTRNLMSNIYRKEKQYSRAFEQASTAWKIRQDVYGDENLLTSISFGNLCQIAMDSAQSGQEKPLISEDELYAGLKQTVRIRKRCCEKQNSGWYGRALLDLARFELATDRMEEAAVTLIRAEQVFTEIADFYYLLYTVEKEIQWYQMNLSKKDLSPVCRDEYQRLHQYHLRHFAQIVEEKDLYSHPAVKRILRRMDG